MFTQLLKWQSWDQIQAVWFQGISSYVFIHLLIICPLLSSKLEEGTDSSILLHILFG